MPLFLAAVIVMSCMTFGFGASAASATRTVGVTLEGGEIMRGRALLIDSITYVPLRDFSNAMGGCEISWNGSTNTASVRASGLTLDARVGSLYINANERYFYTVGQILNINGSVYVPIRPLTRAFGLDLAWDGASYTAALSYNGEGYCESGTTYYISDQVYWLSRIINAESSSESMLGKIAVGNVIMNRVDDPRYPNTIYTVIFDNKYGTQFTPAATGTVYKTPSADSVIAAKICLEGYSISDDIIFFLNPKIATSTWISRNCTYVMTIGNHVFYK